MSDPYLEPRYRRLLMLANAVIDREDTWHDVTDPSALQVLAAEVELGLKVIPNPDETVRIRALKDLNTRVRYSLMRAHIETYADVVQRADAMQKCYPDLPVQEAFSMGLPNFGAWSYRELMVTLQRHNLITPEDEHLFNL